MSPFRAPSPRILSPRTLPLAVLLLLVGLVMAPAPAGAQETPQTVAFFGMVFINGSPAPTTQDENRRLAALEARLREGMEASGRYVFVDTAPVAEKAALYSDIVHCNGCDARLAKELGADLALTGVVQKTSNLILSFTVLIRDAATGELVGGGSADIRGNTDRTWQRGIDYILENRILRE